MARRSPSPPAPPSESPADRLQAAVVELADNVRVLNDIVEQIREDLSWMTRNGLPHQPLSVLVHRMPLLPNAERRAGSFEFSLLSSPVRDPTEQTLSDDRLRAAVVDQIVERLAEPLGHFAQEQLNILVAVVDHAHRELLKAIRDPQAVSSAQEPASKERSPTKPRRRRTNQQPPESTVPNIPIPTVASAAPNTAVESTVSIDPPPPSGRLF